MKDGTASTVALTTPKTVAMIEEFLPLWETMSHPDGGDILFRLILVCWTLAPSARADHLPCAQPISPPSILKTKESVHALIVLTPSSLPTMHWRCSFYNMTWGEGLRRKLTVFLLDILLFIKK